MRRSTIFEQDEPDLVPVNVFVQRRDFVRECRQLAEQLHPNQPPADDHECEMPTLTIRVRLDVGALEPFDDVVAEQERIRQCLERESVL